MKFLRRPTLALVMGLVLVACSVLAFHHEATVAHVRTASGVTMHAPATDCRDGARHTHAHPLRSDQPRDFESCELTAYAQHAFTIFDPPIALVTRSTIVTLATIAPHATHARPTLLLDAPKTSPPV
ncbi:MAG: hypothetical protein NT062_21540 [Proteobacteria bacterium]|nr:hypothetical protein [Pseudomonadota bacterium]